MTAKPISRFLLNLVFGLGVCTVLLLGLEGLARIALSPMKKIPELAPPDRGSYLIRKNGYRGKRPCNACAPNTVRIVAMGGSSTFGVPMYYSGKTYPACLQKFFDQRRTEAQVEVLNGGVAGFGIWQIIETLENAILADKPDVVMISAWFNDSSFIPGWYGFHGLSDHEAYQEVQKLRTIEKNPLYRFVSTTRLYNFLRTFFHRNQPPVAKDKTSRKKRKKRSTPAEFRLGVERFLELSREHRFRPIFLLEPLNRTSPRKEAVKGNKYYQVLEELAAAHNVTIIDTLTPLAQRKEEWLFYDFIHPNEHGHEIIAEAVFQGLGQIEKQR